MSKQSQQRKVIFTELSANAEHSVLEGCITLSVVAITGTVTVTELETNTSHTFLAADDVPGEELPVLTGNDRYKAFSITTGSTSSAKITEVR